MRKKLLDILACPMCGHYPLKLLSIEEDQDKVVTGVLYCENCGRWYPIKDEIAIMLPDNMRDEKADEEFYAKHQQLFDQNRIPRRWGQTAAATRPRASFSPNLRVL